MAAQINKPIITLLIPVFNEEDAIKGFIEEIERCLVTDKFIYEYLFVNDGSTDSTLTVLNNLLESHKNITVINLSRNFGKEVALSAGIDYAQGDAVVAIDVDLQDPPMVIHAFVEKWQQGYDVVYGQRRSRKKDSFIKKISAMYFYKIFNMLSSVEIPYNVGDFRLIDKKVVKTLRLIPERNRFMKGLFAWVGYSTTSITYDRPERFAGTTKWNTWRLWNFAIDGILGFSSIPLRVWSYLGFVIALFAFFYGFFIILRTLILDIDVPGYASIITIILFLGGIQLFSIGIIGEYIGRIFLETKRRPLYVVKEVLETDKKKDA